MIFIGNHDRHLGIPQNLIFNPENGFKSLRRGNFKILIALLGKMGRHCTFSRLNGITLGIDVRGNASRMGAPVIEQLGHMHHTFRTGGQTQDHIMVLAAVKLRPEQLRTLQQFPVKRTEMADVIISPQIIRGKIRLEMQSDHIIYCLVPLKSRFVTIDVIRTLFTDCFHVFIQYTGMKHVIMVKQGNIISCCHGIAGIGIA